VRRWRRKERYLEEEAWGADYLLRGEARLCWIEALVVRS
jgi:hypothetical protein